jgi:hypothetical protein
MRRRKECVRRLEKGWEGEVRKTKIFSAGLLVRVAHFVKHILAKIFVLRTSLEGGWGREGEVGDVF